MKGMYSILFVWLSAATAAVGQANVPSLSSGTIRLYPEVTSESTIIRLGDIAEIRGTSESVEKQLSELEIARASEGVSQLALGYFEIRRALAQAKITPASIDLYGAMRCQVVLGGAAAENASEIKPSDPETTPVETVEEAPAILPEVYGEDSLASELTRRLAREGGYDVSRLQVSWRPRDKEMLAERAARFVIQSRSSLSLGKVSFEVTPLVEGSETEQNKTKAKPVQVIGEASYMCESYVAARMLQAGEVIGPEDIQKVIRRVEHLREIGVTDPEAVIGMEVTRTIPAHHLLLGTMVQKVLVVKRNDIVEVTSRAGRVEITTQGIAKTDGGIGDTITVCDEINKSLIRGRITGPGQVSVTSKMSALLPMAAATLPQPATLN